MIGLFPRLVQLILQVMVVGNTPFRVILVPYYIHHLSTK